MSVCCPSLSHVLSYSFSPPYPPPSPDAAKRQRQTDNCEHNPVRPRSYYRFAKGTEGGETGVGYGEDCQHCEYRSWERAGGVKGG